MQRWITIHASPASPAAGISRFHRFSLSFANQKWWLQERLLRQMSKDKKMDIVYVLQTASLSSRLQGGGSLTHHSCFPLPTSSLISSAGNESLPWGSSESVLCSIDVLLLDSIVLNFWCHWEVMRKARLIVPDWSNLDRENRERVLKDKIVPSKKKWFERLKWKVASLVLYMYASCNTYRSK